MEYLADTVTVIRHFSETGKIGKRAFEIINSKIPILTSDKKISSANFIETIWT